MRGVVGDERGWGGGKNVCEGIAFLNAADNIADHY